MTPFPCRSPHGATRAIRAQAPSHPPSPSREMTLVELWRELGVKEPPATLLALKHEYVHCILELYYAASSSPVPSSTFISLALRRAPIAAPRAVTCSAPSPRLVESGRAGYCVRARGQSENAVMKFVTPTRPFLKMVAGAFSWVGTHMASIEHVPASALCGGTHWRQRFDPLTPSPSRGSQISHFSIDQEIVCSASSKRLSPLACFRSPKASTQIPRALLQPWPPPSRLALPKRTPSATATPPTSQSQSVRPRRAWLAGRFV